MPTIKCERCGALSAGVPGESVPLCGKCLGVQPGSLIGLKLRREVRTKMPQPEPFEGIDRPDGDRRPLSNRARAADPDSETGWQKQQRRGTPWWMKANRA